jgi:small subunit ribosomal protein S1
MEHNQESEFEKLLNENLSEKRSLEPGQLIEAEIVSISEDCIFLQLDGKSEGQLDAAELIDNKGNMTVQEGDKIKAFFLSGKNGIMQFTTRISGDKAEDTVLRSAFENGIPVEGIVEKEIKGGFQVKIGETRAFCPFSQMGMQRIENPGDYAGKHLTFKITEYGEKGRNIIVSNRAILEEERQKKIELLKESLKEGMTITGTVKSIQSFGAFIDIGGVQALLPISEISRDRVEDIHKVLAPGQEIEAAILKLDWKNEKLTVSMKKLLPDPWDEAASKYPKGSTHKGTVVRLMNFGAFVNLEPGLDGLVHISDLKGDERIDHPRDAVKAGQTLEVEINDVDVQKKRISLKPAGRSQLDESFSKYMDSEPDTYNPFSALLKDNKDN